mgnify:FL=1
MAKHYKGTIKGHAQISICRNNHEMVVLEIRDSVSRDTILELEMTAEAFGEAITGWARRPAKLCFNLDYDPKGDGADAETVDRA